VEEKKSKRKVSTNYTGMYSSVTFLSLPTKKDPAGQMTTTTNNNDDKKTIHSSIQQFMMIPCELFLLTIAIRMNSPNVTKTI
jgi:hypothetical protein